MQLPKESGILVAQQLRQLIEGGVVRAEAPVEERSCNRRRSICAWARWRIVCGRVFSPSAARSRSGCGSFLSMSCLWRTGPSWSGGTATSCRSRSRLPCLRMPTSGRRAIPRVRRGGSMCLRGSWRIAAAASKVCRGATPGRFGWKSCRGASRCGCSEGSASISCASLREAGAVAGGAAGLARRGAAALR
jgi:hypothetical protein